MAEQEAMTQHSLVRRVSLSALLLSIACGDEPTWPDAGPRDAGPPITTDGGPPDAGESHELRVEITETDARIQPGDFGGYEVTIYRDGYVGDLEVSVEGLPTGVTVEPSLLASVIASGWVALDVAEEAAHGSFPVTITVDSTDGVHHLEVSTELVIAGPPGTLDPSFGVGGISEPIRLDGWISDVRRDGRGRIVVAGVSYDDPATHALVARFTEAGETDAEFGDYGVWLDTGADSAIRHLVLVDDAPRALMWRYDGGFQDVVRAWNVDGGIEAEFGSDGEWLAPEDTGTITTDGENLYVAAFRQLVTLDDRGSARAVDILIPRMAVMESAGDFLIAGLSGRVLDGEAPMIGRLVADAAELDPTFGTDGLAYHSADPELTWAGAYRIAMGDDGGGYAAVDTMPHELIRFDSSGRVNTDFARVRLTGERTRVSGLAVDLEGRLVAMVELRAEDGSAVREIRRYTERGAPDRSFGAEGIVSLPGVDASFAQTIVHDPTLDRLIACGADRDESQIRCARFWL